MPDPRQIGFSVEAKNAQAARRAIEGFIGTFEELAELIAKFGGTIGKYDNQINIDLGVLNADNYVKVDNMSDSVNNLEKAENKAIATNKRLLKLQVQGATLARQRLSQAKQELGAYGPLTNSYKIQAEKVQKLTEEYRRAQAIMPNSVQDIQEIGSALQAQANKLTLSQQKTSGLTSKIDENAIALLKAKGAQKGSVDILKLYQQKAQQLASTLPIGSKEQLKAAKAAQTYGRRIEAAGGKTTGFISILGKLSTIQSGILAISTAFGQVGGAINTVVNRTKSVEAFSLALQNVGLSSVETAQKFNVAAQSATALGAPVEQVEKAFKRIVPALRAIGSSSSDTNKFIEGLTARTQVLGLTTEESGRLQEAFAQVLSKGKLQAEELTQQISEVDGAFRTQFADALGVTVEKLGELVENGQVTSSVFVDAFLKMQNGVEALQGKITNGTATIQQLQNNIGNIQTKSLEAIGEAAEPGIRAILELTNNFAVFIKEAIDSPWGKGLINAFNSVMGAIKNLGNLFIGLAKAIGAVLAPLGPLFEALSNFVGPIAAILAPIVAVRIATVLYQKANEKLLISFQAGNKTLGAFRSTLLRFGKSLKSLIKGDSAGFFSNLTQSFRNLKTTVSRGLLGDAPEQFDKLRKARKLAAAPVKASNLYDAAKTKVAANAAGKLTAKLGANKTAALAAKAGLASLGLAGSAAVAGVAVAVAAGALVFNEYQRSIGALMKPIKETESTLKDLGIETVKAKSFMERLGDGLISLVPFLGQTIDAIGGMIEGLKRFGRELAFRDAMDQMNKQLGAFNKFAESKGVNSLLNLSEASKLAAGDLLTLKKGANALKKGFEGSAAAIQKDIDAMKASKNPNADSIAQLERQKDAFLEKAAAQEIALDGLRGLSGITIQTVDGEGTLAQKLDVSNKGLAQRKEKLEQVASALNVEAQKAFNQGLITEGQLTLQNAAIAEQTSKSRLADIQAAIDLNFKRQAQSNQDVVALRNQARQLKTEQVAATQAVQAAEEELRKAMIDRLKEVKAENDQLVSSYTKLKDIQKGGFSDLTSGITSTFDKFKTAINKAATIEFLVTGDQSILDDAVKLEGEMFKMQFEIDRIKRKVQQSEKLHKLEMIQLESKAQIEMLKAEPATAHNQARIAALQNIIGMTENYKNMQQGLFKLEDLASRSEVAAAQQAINLRRQAAGLPPIKLVDPVNMREFSSIINNIGRDVTASAVKMGNGVIEANNKVIKIGEQGLSNIQSAGQESTREVRNSVKALQDGAKDLDTEGNKIDQNFFGLDVNKVKAALGESVGVMESGLTSVQGKVQNLNKEFGNTGAAIRNMGSEADKSLTNISKAVSATNSLKTAMQGVPFGSRATGGPVTGGETYKVNDGGGRESFVDSAGKVSLLPAARNIKWRAPKAGYVLNAHDTGTLIKNQKINASINAATRSAKPARESQSVAGIVPSGTLIKQMGSMMKGGDTQRITNNVTIQSQSPVMDASKILTDINIMKARRGGRL